MLALDTNVLVRYLVRDDEHQYLQAESVMRELNKDFRAYLSWTVLLEVFFVLKRVYRFQKSDLIRVIGDILRVEEFLIEDAALVYSALQIYRSAPVDFQDAMIAVKARAQGIERILTFDRKAEEAGMEVITPTRKER